MKIILLFVLIAISGCASIELRSGTWFYQYQEIPVYKNGDKYNAYVWGQGVFELNKYDDGLFRPVSFSAFQEKSKKLTKGN